MRKVFFNPTGCKCILKLQAEEDLANNRCIRCQAVTKEKELADRKEKEECEEVKIDETRT